MFELKLTEQEYKDLVIKVAVKTSPILVKKKPDSAIAADTIAYYVRDIADAVNVVLKGGC